MALDITVIQKEMLDYDRDIWNEKKIKNKEYIEHFNEKSRITLNNNNNGK
jgi:hypothetical protein